MRYFTLAIGFSLLLTAQLKSQTSFGLKGGGNLSRLGINNDKVIVGYHIGAFASIDLSKSLYLQPEIMYTTRGTELPDYMVFGDPLSFDFNYISIPVLVGVQITDHLSVQLGPEFNFLAGSETNYIDQTTDDSDFYATFDPVVTAGVQYQLLDRLGLYFRYSHGFTELIDIRFTDGNGQGLGTLQDGKTRSMQLGLSYALSKNSNPAFE